LFLTQHLHVMSKSVVDEEREINEVHYQRGGGFTVGEDGITKIEAYEENGQMAPVPWIAVYREGELHRRIPAREVVICYDTPEPEDETDPPDDLPF